jgi:hypothetical protein
MRFMTAVKMFISTSAARSRTDCGSLLAMNGRGTKKGGWQLECLKCETELVFSDDAKVLHLKTANIAKSVKGQTIGITDGTLHPAASGMHEQQSQSRSTTDWQGR